MRCFELRGGVCERGDCSCTEFDPSHAAANGSECLPVGRGRIRVALAAFTVALGLQSTEAVAGGVFDASFITSELGLSSTSGRMVQFDIDVNYVSFSGSAGANPLLASFDVFFDQVDSAGDSVFLSFFDLITGNPLGVTTEPEWSVFFVADPPPDGLVVIDWFGLTDGFAPGGSFSFSVIADVGDYAGEFTGPTMDFYALDATGFPAEFLGSTVAASIPAPIPLPTPLGLGSAGLIGIAIVRRRRREVA